ncbi:carboxymuconolactone decarboxylase family protein [Actinacidiphila sp. DG2A-62]|uniref:carboxymuconolactone decarboxylase family protein n=1 Tax=Actinacidiphila sp. DG2A-62 TaxID=3108821 RepID=UPI002DBEE7B3|nr:carboxymuconolactone decarboxylase family protein [Actinacidiphila sp. DG2A-62]MEC3997084.1 carboxymuconolactone decarboxylase family protein [Actinacidiphila sp. DG2A-62]
MPLLRQVSLHEVKDADIREHYRRTFGDRDPVAEPGTASGTPGDWWTTFALSPSVLRNSADFLLMAADPESKLSLSPRHRELGVLRQAWVNGCKFIFSQHCKSARMFAGISDEEIAAIPNWQVSPLFTPVERALLTLTDAITSEHGRVEPKVVEVLQDGLPDEAILEFSYIVSLYMAHGTMIRALRLEYDNVDDPIVEVPAPDPDKPFG